MAMEDIKKNLEKRFSEPLPEFYDRRIIFWNDEEKEFLDEINELELSNAKVLVLTETNNFFAKKMLSFDDEFSNYLVYNCFDTNMEDDWFLDVKLYSEEFRADQLSMWMQEMNIEPNPAVRNKIKMYRGFLNAAGRRKLVSQFGSEITSPSKLHLAILASICKVRTMNPKDIIKAVMADGPDIVNSLKMSMLTYNATETFWALVNRATGYFSDNVSNIDEMNQHIILSALTKTMDEKYLSGLEQRYNSFHNGFCYEMLYEWLHSDQKETLADVLRYVEKELRLTDRFSKNEISALVDTELLPCLDEVILNKLMQRIVNHTIDADEVIAIIEKRRTMVWYSINENYYNALLQVANIQKFYNEHINGFHHVSGKDIWNKYTSEYYLMDSYYRNFHVAFARSLTNPNQILDDEFRNVVDEVEGIYKNWYLDQLAENFTNVIETDLKTNGVIQGLNPQERFYSGVVSQYDNKVFVIVSDALRYEVATSIANELKTATKSDVSIESQQAVFPSITKFGMAALLPHQKLSLNMKSDGISVLVNDQSSEMNDRDAILKKRNPNSVAIRYKDFILMKKDEQRELIKGQEVIYIYHDTIDSTGHHDEMNVFTACETAKEEIVSLVKTITNSLNGLNVVITSDHGFLYTYKPLLNSDRMDRSSFKQDIIEQGRRYVITDEKADPDFLMPVKGFYNDEGYQAFAPRENIRIKGSGRQNFVHGGASLQELVVPVIRYKFLRSGYKEYEKNKEKYDSKPVSLILLSAGRKISNMIFNLSFYQKESVKDNYVACTYQVFLTDSEGNVISDIQKIVADRSSTNNTDREYRSTFNLKQQKYSNREMYYLVIQDEDGLQVPIKEEMQIDISMAFDDFDFFE